MAYLLRRLWHSIPNALQSVINGILSVCIPETEEEVGVEQFIVWNDDQFIVWNTNEFIVWSGV